MTDLAIGREIATIPMVVLRIQLRGPITAATASVLADTARTRGPALRLHDGGYPGRYPSFEGFLDTYPGREPVRPHTG